MAKIWVPIYYDTEFVPTRDGAELVSIGIVDQRGNTLYHAVSNEFNMAAAEEVEVLRRDVLPNLPPMALRKSWSEIANELREMTSAAVFKPKYWDREEDAVLFRHLMANGKFKNMPFNVLAPYNLKQEWDNLDLDPSLLPVKLTNHDVLMDAAWAAEIDNIIERQKQLMVPKAA